MVYCADGFVFSIISDNNEIRTILEKYSQHHLSVMLLDKQAKIFFCSKLGGIGFVNSKKYVLSIGGIMAGEEFKSKLFCAFLDWARTSKYSVGFVHFIKSDIKILNQYGFRTNQIGATFSKKFENFKPAGKLYQQLRRKQNKALRSGVTVREITSSNVFLKLRSELSEINESWLKHKKAKPLRHLVFDFDTMNVPSEDNRLLVAYHDGLLVSYTIFSRTYGDDAGWFCSISRHRQGCVDGTMQLIMSRMVDLLGSSVMHFGFTPLVDMGDDFGRNSAIFSKIANKLALSGGVVYPSASQRQYKVSWNPTQIESEYFAYEKGVLPAVFSLLRITNSI